MVTPCNFCWPTLPALLLHHKPNYLKKLGMRPLCFYFYLLCFLEIPFIVTDYAQNYAYKLNEIRIAMKPKIQSCNIRKEQSRSELKFNAYGIGA